MRSPGLPSSVGARVLAGLGSLAVLAACSTVHSVGHGLGLSTATQLSYAQVQSIQPGLSAAQIRDAFGPPMSAAKGPSGRVSRMEYVAMDAKQSRARLVLDFDERETLVTRMFTGEVVRP